jgi:hypothetical protein
MNRSKTFLALGAFALFAAAPLSAQQNEAQVTATWSVSAGLTITLDETEIDFGTLVPGDDEYGFATPNVAISAVSNVDFDVLIEADAAQYEGTGPGGTAYKDASDIQWSLDGMAWTALSTTAATIATGVSAGTHTGTWTLQHRIVVNPTEPVATYSATWTLSVVPTS